MDDVLLSDCSTPVDDDEVIALDPDQVRLRLHLIAAVEGETSMPNWAGLAEALRVYFTTSWHKDAYTLQECEQHRDFLFWNAVGNEKWRLHSSGQE